MLDLIMLGSLLAVAIAVSSAARSGRWGRSSPRVALDDPFDLPCPWCRAATREEDTRCPNCMQRFG